MLQLGPAFLALENVIFLASPFIAWCPLEDHTKLNKPACVDENN